MLSNLLSADDSELLLAAWLGEVSLICGLDAELLSLLSFSQKIEKISKIMAPVALKFEIFPVFSARKLGFFPKSRTPVGSLVRRSIPHLWT